MKRAIFQYKIENDFPNHMSDEDIIEFVENLVQELPDYIEDSLELLSINKIKLLGEI
tara:strand:- start:47 stop:217 length:171 start_codon:yes stop_codon:yes gene_type:complete